MRQNNNKMLNKSKLISHTRIGIGEEVADSPPIMGAVRKKLKDAMEHVINAHEELTQTLTDSIQNFKIESQEKNDINEKLITEFRESRPIFQDGLVAKYLSKVDELEKKNSEMKRKLDEYKMEGQGKWISFKHDFNHDMSGLEKALKDLNIVKS